MTGVRHKRIAAALDRYNPLLALDFPIINWIGLTPGAEQLFVLFAQPQLIELVDWLNALNINLFEFLAGFRWY